MNGWMNKKIKEFLIYFELNENFQIICICSIHNSMICFMSF